MASQAPFSGVLDELKEQAETERVSAGDILDTFEQRSLGVLLTLFGLIAALPIIGGIPGVSLGIATLVLIAVAHALFGGSRLWMPRTVRKRSISGDTFRRGIEKVRPWVAWTDKLLKPRLTWLVAGKTASTIVALCAAVLALTMYPLAVVPWGVTPPALGILALGLGLMACDGLMVLIGYGLAAPTAYLLYTAL